MLPQLVEFPSRINQSFFKLLSIETPTTIESNSVENRLLIHA